MPKKPACGPCNQNCGQGRNCPARQAAQTPQFLVRILRLLRPQQAPRTASPH